MAGYTPPPGNSVVIQLISAGYTPPSGDYVLIQLQQNVGEQSISPSGVDWSAHGSASIQNFTRYIIGATASEQLSTGVASISTPPVDLDIYTAGTDFVGVGFGSGGGGFIDFRIRYLSDAGSINQDGYGVLLADDGIREVDLNPSHGIESQAFGAQFVAHQLRELRPGGVFGSLYGFTMAGGDRSLVLSGLDALAVGTHHVLDNTQRAYPTGLSGELGYPTMRLEYRTLKPVGLFVPEEARLGLNTSIHLDTRYLRPRNEDDFWNHGGIGSAYAYNRNRIVDVSINGVSPPFRQIPLTHDIKNNARLLRPSGIDSRADGQTLVADAIRNVYPSGYKRAVGIGEYAVVWNSARVVGALGANMVAYGTAAMQNTRRYFRHITAGGQESYGSPFVAFGERSILARPIVQFGAMVPDPTAWFRNREVAPAPVGGAFPGAAFGVADFSKRFNIVRARPAVNAQRWGESAVRNNTPQLYPYYDGGPVFGQASIRTAFRHLPVQGEHTVLFGITDVSYRTKRLFPQSILSFRDNLFHRIYKATPDPPGPQYLLPSSVLFASISLDHSITANSICPLGADMSRIGDAGVRDFGILPKSITPPYEYDNSQIGMPSIVRNRTLWVLGFDFIGIGVPDFKPRTIWAPTGAPQQAIDNHPGDHHVVDFYETSPPGAGMPEFGSHAISNFHREVLTSTVFSSIQLGSPSITTNPQHVRPEGEICFKSGFPMTSRAGDTFPFGYDFASFGEASIQNEPEMIRYVRATGNEFVRFGAADPQNFHRELPMDGLQPLVFGQNRVQRPPPPAMPAGMDATVFGSSMVAYRIRTYQLSGFDALRVTWTPGSFALRMRVDTEAKLTPPGLDTGALGAAWISMRNQQVLANGIDAIHNAIPSGARVKGLDRISVAGYGLEAGPEFGDAWVMAVVHGAILPRGDAHDGYGMPNIGAQGIAPVGLHDDAVPDPSVVAEIAPLWEAGESFGTPVFIGDGCGPQYRVMSGQEHTTMGESEVSHG